MKKIIIILLLVVLAVGMIQPLNVFSEISESLDPPDTLDRSNDESLPEQLTEPVFTKRAPLSDLSLVSYFIWDNISPEGSVSYLTLSDESENYTRYGLTFHGLTPGKTYVFYFEIDPVFEGAMRPKKYYLEWAESMHSYEFPTGMDEEPLGEGYITFTAEDTSVNLILIDKPFTTNQDDLDLYSLSIDTFVKFKLYE